MALPLWKIFSRLLTCIKTTLKYVILGVLVAFAVTLAWKSRVWVHGFAGLVPGFRRLVVNSIGKIDVRIFSALLVGAVSGVCVLRLVSSKEGRGQVNPEPIAPQHLFEIPDNACYFCVRRPATSKCGSCRLVYYCCRLCQMQAWRKHRHVCGAAASAASRIHRVRDLITPSQWRALLEYGDFVKGLTSPEVVVPTNPEMVASVLFKIGMYVRQRPEIVCQQMADSVWAAALSMRSENLPDRLHMAWAWGFLEASVESGSADAFLEALRIDDLGNADLARVNRWMKRGLCQALLMLNRRQEVGAFFRAAPRQQLLYY